MSDAASKEYRISDQLILNNDEPICQSCGGNVDTGWECIDCGYDNIDWYYPKGRESQEVIMVECKSGKLIPENGECKYCGAAPFTKCLGA